MTTLHVHHVCERADSFLVELRPDPDLTAPPVRVAVPADHLDPITTVTRRDAVCEISQVLVNLPHDREVPVVQVSGPRVMDDGRPSVLHMVKASWTLADATVPPEIRAALGVALDTVGRLEGAAA
jgi:hypothetical protein